MFDYSFFRFKSTSLDV